MASANGDGDGDGRLVAALAVARVYYAEWIFPCTASPPASSISARWTRSQAVVHTKPNDRAVVRKHGQLCSLILDTLFLRCAMSVQDTESSFSFPMWRFASFVRLLDYSNTKGEPESRGIGYRSQKPRDETEEKAVLWPSLYAPVRLILRLPNDGCAAAVSLARRISGAPWFSGLLLLLIEEKKRFPVRRN
ncbi:hypothetical protein ABZP36_023693 [Zizania latifolia]